MIRKKKFEITREKVLIFLFIFSLILFLIMLIRDNTSNKNPSINDVYKPIEEKQKEERTATIEEISKLQKSIDINNKNTIKQIVINEKFEQQRRKDFKLLMKKLNEQNEKDLNYIDSFDIYRNKDVFTDIFSDSTLTR